MRGEQFIALTEQETGQHVVTRVRHVAAALPHAVAVDDGTERLGFAELERRAAALSARVAAVAPEGEPVAVLHGHDAAAAVAVLAVIGTGAPVVVLDPTTPVARLRHYVEQSGASTVVTDGARADDAALLCPRVVRSDRALAALADPAEGGGDDGAGTGWPRTPDELLPGDPVAIIYTSGSTGRPKGVVSDSAAVLHDATTNGRGCYGPGAVVANLLPMAFSAGIGLLLAGLVTGSTQALFDPRTRPVSELPAWLLARGATVLAASPAILRGAVASLGEGEQLGHLRAVTTAGETIHAAEMARLRAALGPGCAVHNRYGSSETWLIAEHVIHPGDPDPVGAVPVGRPVEGAVVEVLDEAGQRHRTGTGRLVVTSRWLTRGYWRAPEATAAVFTHHPDGTTSYLTSDAGTVDDDGTVRLLGRVDHSVKVRGHLVEPGEVDAVLHAHPGVREAVVVGATTDGRSRLVAYVVPEGGGTTVPELRRAVRRALPAFMVPEQVVLLDALPRTERGKLDRAALPPPPPMLVGVVPPRTDWERAVAAFVARALDLEAVGAHDDFFELGGDSLAVEALLAAMSASLQVPDTVLTSQLVVENPTVAELAAALRRRRRSGVDASVITFNGSGTRPPLFVMAGAGGVALAFRGLADRLGRDQPVVALQARGLEGGGRPEWSVRSRARHHLAQVRSVQPHGPYRVAGHSLGALVAVELAHQLRAAGEEVESLVVIDSFAPDPASAPPALEGSLPVRAKTLASILLTGVVQSHGLGHYDRFHLQGKLLQRWYRTTRWSGRTLVVVAQDDPDADARALWGEHLSGSWKLRRTAGDHTGVLQEPHVRALAALVAEELRDVDEAAGRPPASGTAAPTATATTAAAGRASGAA